jgi:hypothetical protein
MKEAEFLCFGKRLADSGTWRTYQLSSHLPLIRTKVRCELGRSPNGSRLPISYGGVRAVPYQWRRANLLAPDSEAGGIDGMSFLPLTEIPPLDEAPLVSSVRAAMMV